MNTHHHHYHLLMVFLALLDAPISMHATWVSSAIRTSSTVRRPVRSLLLLTTTRRHHHEGLLSLSSNADDADADTDASSLLYKEQEKMLVQRGEFEGRLMSTTTNNSKTPTSATTSILQPNLVKGAGSSGGFGGGGVTGKKKKKGGGGSNSKNSGTTTTQLKAQGKAHAKVLQRDGVVRIDNVLPDNLADELREMVYEMRAESQEAVAAGKVKSLQRFADVLLKENRCDMTIPLVYDESSDTSLNVQPERHARIVKAVTQILQKSPLGATIQQLFGDDAILYELSCLMSDPGSQRQVMHPDTPYGGDSQQAVLYTCFVALQDIEINMGPTTWLPGTHTKEMHEQFQDETPLPLQTNDNNDTDDTDTEIPRAKTPKDLLLQQKPAVLGTLPKGCCAIFDSRLLHCGGANTSDKSRALFYCTFRNPKVQNVGNPGSIRRDLIGKFTLAELNRQLNLYNKGKPNDLVVVSSSS